MSARDPLTRWSARLADGWPPRRLPRLFVGLEGCGSAFNALNAIRTCMHFRTAAPPQFLSLESAADIKHLRPRDAAQTGNVHDVIGRVARFGEGPFMPRSDDASEEDAVRDLPLVVFENYVSRAESINACRVPSAARFVVGHENNGISAARLSAAARVLYVPQYGTISSLNVVTSLGIALFTAAMDAHAPAARECDDYSPDNSPAFPGGEHIDALRAYQRHFRQSLPRAGESAQQQQRADARPVHPAFYGRSAADIFALHRRHRALLLRASGAERFGLSVLCENATDQRSLAGIVRSANAFLVDAVCYYGRRKLNVVGTVGTQHYTPPVFVGAAAESARDAPGRWWLLDCAQSALYEKNTARERFDELRRDEQRLRLGDAEERLRREAREGVVLVVPPEGALPPPHVMARCERLLSVGDNEEANECGLPVAVAVGIALQRLSAAMHPQLRGL